MMDFREDQIEFKLNLKKKIFIVGFKMINWATNIKENKNKTEFEIQVNNLKEIKHE